MAEVVNFENLTSFLNGASLHEIYRVSVALFNELQSPKRIMSVKNRIKVGQTVEFFDGETNITHKGIIVSKDIKYVSLKTNESLGLWKIPYHMLVIDSRQFDFSNNGKGLNRNQIKVGELVGFNKDGEEIIGKVERLNQKTVSLITKDNHKWRVAYSHLYSIIDGEYQQGKKGVLIEALS